MRHDAPRDFFLPDFCAVGPLLPLILAAQLAVMAGVLLGLPTPHQPWASLALPAMGALWVVLMTAGLLCPLRRRLAALPLAWAASLCLLLVVGVTALVTVAGLWLIDGALDRPWWDGWLVLRNALVAAVFGGIALRYLYVTAELRRRDQATMRAQLAALTARIRPHFLFNAMNSIASLIPSRPEIAEQAVEDLAELFRAALARAGDEVTWEEEARLCQRYLHIEALRLGPRLTVDWQADALPGSLPIPALSLQPLLENAVYHGIQSLPEGGTVTVRGALEADRVRIRVENPVGGHTPASTDGNRMALDNIRARLRMLYGERADLRAGREAQHFVAELDYPLPAGRR